MDPFEQLQQNVDRFFYNYNDIILEEHRNMIKEMVEYLKEFHNVKKVNSNFGNHYENCPWAKNTCECGPTKCSCYYADKYYTKLITIMILYRRIKTNCK